MKTNKKYKALMLDLDGTTIPNKWEGRPSLKVVEAIGKAKRKLQVSVATARPYYEAKHIVRDLGLEGPSIFSGGAEIRDTDTGDVLWSKKISEKTTREVLRIFKKKKLPLIINDNDYYEHQRVFDPNNPPKEPLVIAVPEIKIFSSENFIKVLGKFRDIAVHKGVGWKSDTVWILISNTEASKQHGIFEIAKLLGIKTHEIIGVGDGYNDFPLLMACGLRIAMGNAVDELKKIADYIAPSVNDDGVVDVINKFVLR